MNKKPTVKRNKKMTEEDFYFDEGHIKITVASIGISAKRWTCINEQEITKENYQDIMKKNRFDVLPIISKGGKTIGFFKTDVQSNYDKVSRHKISDASKILFDTDIREGIDKFNNENAHYYFLTSKIK